MAPINYKTKSSAEITTWLGISVDNFALSYFKTPKILTQAFLD